VKNVAKIPFDQPPYMLNIAANVAFQKGMFYADNDCERFSSGPKEGFMKHEEWIRHMYPGYHLDLLLRVTPDEDTRKVNFEALK
jgi:hypothetical protein